MNSLYNLIYVQVNEENMSIAYNIQKKQWPDTPDYSDIYDKAVNTKDDNIMFLVYDKNNLIGITGVDVYRNFPGDYEVDDERQYLEYKGNVPKVMEKILKDYLYKFM